MEADSDSSPKQETDSRSSGEQPDAEPRLSSGGVLLCISPAIGAMHRDCANSDEASGLYAHAHARIHASVMRSRYGGGKRDRIF